MNTYLAWYYRTCAGLCAVNALNNRRDFVKMFGWMVIAYVFLGLYFDALKGV